MTAKLDLLTLHWLPFRSSPLHKHIDTTCVWTHPHRALFIWGLLQMKFYDFVHICKQYTHHLTFSPQRAEGWRMLSRST